MIKQTAAPSLGRGARLLAIALAGTIAMAIAIASGPVSDASAAWSNTFCSDVWLQPYGQGGDSCTMGEGYANHYSDFAINTQDKSGCVSATGYYGEQVMSWVCTGSWSQQFVYPPDPGGWYRGTIRNNNQNAAGWFSGTAYCDPSRCV